MNTASIKKEKSKNSCGTNYRIRIERKNSVDDGQGYTPFESEAVRMFQSILKQCKSVLKAELWYDGKLIKKV